VSVVSAEKLTGRTGDASADVREHFEIWEVITSVATDTQEEIIASGMIPTGYESFPADPAARVSRLSFEQDPDEPTWWRVRITYSTRQPPPAVGDSGSPAPGSSPEDNYNDDPRSKPAQVSLRTESIQWPLVVDLDGVPINDATNRPFSIQVIEWNGLVLSISKNMSSVPIATMRAYANAVNSDTYFGATAGHIKMLSIRADTHFDKETFYWSVNCEMFLADDDFIEQFGPLDILRLRNRGPEYLTTAGGTTRRRHLVDGQLAECDLALDGTKLAEGADPTYLDFRIKPRRPFTALGLFP
jgi:hypothetical protein